jgi:hypothetical protein
MSDKGSADSRLAISARSLQAGALSALLRAKFGRYLPTRSDGTMPSSRFVTMMNAELIPLPVACLEYGLDYCATRTAFYRGDVLGVRSATGRISIYRASAERYAASRCSSPFPETPVRREGRSAEAKARAHANRLRNREREIAERGQCRALVHAESPGELRRCKLPVQFARPGATFCANHDRLRNYGVIPDGESE